MKKWKYNYRLGRLCKNCDSQVSDRSTSGLCEKCIGLLHFKNMKGEKQTLDSILKKESELEPESL